MAITRSMNFLLIAAGALVGAGEAWLIPGLYRAGLRTNNNKSIVQKIEVDAPPRNDQKQDRSVETKNIHPRNKLINNIQSTKCNLIATMKNIYCNYNFQ